MVAVVVMILSSTTSFCRECGISHPAQYRRDDNRVFFDIECPSDRRSVLVSTDADLFESIRKRHAISSGEQIRGESTAHFFFLEITDSCNMECPICYSSSGPSGQYFMDLDTVRDLGKRISARGGKWVSLTGGDPSQHPQLRQILRLLKQDLGLSPLIVTNGLCIARDPGWLDPLIDVGLKKIQLQFDTFDDETYRLMRARSDLSEKYRAIEAICSAGLRLGIVTTVCRRNIAEVNKIVDFATGLTPSLNTLILQCMLPAGRFPSDDMVVDREAVVKQVAIGGQNYSVSVNDFLPFPHFAPMGFRGHPDCEISTFMEVDGDFATSMASRLDIERLFSTMGSYNKRLSQWSARLALANSVFQSADDFGTFLNMMRRFRSLETGTGAKRSFLITVGSFMHPDCRDEERLGSCVSRNVTPAGFESMCGRDITWAERGTRCLQEGL